MVNVAVVGARGYLGREIVRILLQHPNVERVLPVSKGAQGQLYGQAVPGFRHMRELTFLSSDDPAVHAADVHFFATDAEDAREAATRYAASPLVVDLSRAHRLQALQGATTDDVRWTYGLSELLAVPKGTRRIANPGCYPTASLLAAGPALAKGHAASGPLIADGKSGVSGAGATPRADLHYPDANEAVRAYKVLGHDHLHEIRAAAHKVETRRSSGTTARPVRFTPHLVPMNRGLLSTVYLPCTNSDIETIRKAYTDTYAGAPFVRLVTEPDTSHVRGSNFADVAVDLDADSGLLVARCAIDNLVKGGSGTAVQNMNLALGFPATLGLEHPGGGP